MLMGAVLTRPASSLLQRYAILRCFFPFACKILLFPLLARYCDSYSAPRRNVVDFPNQVLEMSRLNEAAMVSDEAVAGGEAVVADEGGSAEVPAAVTAGDS